MMKSIEEIVSRHPFLEGLDADIVVLIAGCASNVRFATGEYLLHEGDEADRFYLIRQGTVALEMHVPGRDPVVFLTLKEGDMLGTSWLLPPYRWVYDARAVELTRAFKFDAHCVRDKGEQDNRVGYQMMKRFIPPLIERLQAARVQAADIYGPSHP